MIYGEVEHRANDEGSRKYGVDRKELAHNDLADADGGGEQELLGLLLLFLGEALHGENRNDYRKSEDDH